MGLEEQLWQHLGALSAERAQRAGDELVAMLIATTQAADNLRVAASYNGLGNVSKP